MSATRAQGQGMSAEKAAGALGAKLKALAAEAVAEAMAAEKVRVKKELLSQLSQANSKSSYIFDSIAFYNTGSHSKKRKHQKAER